MGKELVTPFQKFEILSHREYRTTNFADFQKSFYILTKSHMFLSVFLFQVFIEHKSVYIILDILSCL